MVSWGARPGRSIRPLVSLLVLVCAAGPSARADQPAGVPVTPPRQPAWIPEFDPEFLDRIAASHEVAGEIEPEPLPVTLRALPPVEPEPAALAWNRKELALKWTYVALSVIDAHQTGNLPPGYRESNPLIASWAGDRPQALEAAVFKAAGTYGLLHLTHRRVKTRRGRKRALCLLIGLQLAAVIHNEASTGGILF